ncbi:glycosyltransferase family 2 protein [Neomoorella thermoacetica]|nr:glycosyltransferase family 2 protein [Moorella thermoacetica]
MRSTTLVIIPAYNEAATIGQVIKNIKRWCDADILVVNDGSTDGTSAAAREEKVAVIDLPCNLGIGGAMQTGYRYACQHGYEFAVQVDADGQHDPRFIEDLIHPLRAGKVDLVIGSRYIENRNYRGTLARRAGSWFFTFLLKLFTGQAIYDTTSGFRAINRQVLAEFARHYPSDYPEVEVIMQLLRRGYRIKEIPVVMYPRKGGHSSITMLKSVYYMFKVSLAMVIDCLR